MFWRRVFVSAIATGKTAQEAQEISNESCSRYHASHDKSARARALALEDAGLSVRAVNALTKAGLSRLGELTRMTPAEVRKIDGIGRPTFEEIVTTLFSFDLSLRTP